ncbi:MAG: hypothetical protein QMD14_02710 [Candidatus Aenigmarchaeota archaeon]|nr:hypothetical protein [Candidatus Aenigmarchaeota archaeon]
MKKTGIFYHEIIGKKADPLAREVEAGFRILEKENLFAEPNIFLFESQPVEEELILQIHPKHRIEEVKRMGYYEVSLYSIGGLVKATEKVLNREIDNALVLLGAGGHHAHRDWAWGGCYFNTDAIPIEYARERFGTRKFAIVDTDTHHADGTRDIFKADEEVLHICYCQSFGYNYWGYNYGSRIETKTKVCFPQANSDEEFIERLEKEVPPRITDFKPELIYWVCGMDTHKHGYGTKKLTEACYPELAKIIKKVTDEVCSSKLIARTGCNIPGYPSAVEYIIPRLVDCLAELNKYI